MRPAAYGFSGRPPSKLRLLLSHQSTNREPAPVLREIQPQRPNEQPSHHGRPAMCRQYPQGVCLRNLRRRQSIATVAHALAIALHPAQRGRWQQHRQFPQRKFPTAHIPQAQDARWCRQRQRTTPLHDGAERYHAGLASMSSRGFPAPHKRVCQQVRYRDSVAQHASFLPACDASSAEAP